MKALFVHDHYYYHDRDHILSQGQFHNSLWQRYLDVFDHLTIIGRDGGQYTSDRTGVNLASRDNVTFALYPNVNHIKGLFCGRKDIKDAIRKQISDHDLLILRGMSEFGMVAYREAKRQGKPIAMEVIGCSWDDMWNHGFITAKLYAPYRFLMNKIMTKNADAVIYVSQEFLQKRYPTNAPIQAAASNVQIDIASCRDVYQNDPSKPLKIGLIGTLDNQLKGVHVALESLRILKDRGVLGFEFHVLGPGDPDSAPINFNETVKKYGLEGMAFYDGMRESGAPVHQWLRDLGLYIQPSFQEGVPRATIEAMAQSLPAIGANAGGIPELLDPSCIVASGDAQGLADKVESMIKNPDMRADHAARNYNVAMRYTMEQLVPIRSEFWKKVKSMVASKQ